MKLKLTLLLMCLLGVGLFSQGQDKPSKPAKADKITVADGKDALPVTVKSNKKSKLRKPPPPPPAPPVVIRKPEQPAPPPPPEKVKIKMNKYVPPPPPPARPKAPAKAITHDAPTAPDRV